MEPNEELLRSLLDVEEPDYAEAAKLGRAALPHLKNLVEDNDPGIGPKAAYLAGRIGDAAAAPILESAAASPDPGFRAAAAGGARFLPGGAGEPVLLLLIDDSNSSIRKVSLQSVPADAGPELAAKVNRRVVVEQLPSIKGLAEDVLTILSSEESQVPPLS